MMSFGFNKLLITTYVCVCLNIRFGWRFYMYLVTDHGVEFARPLISICKWDSNPNLLNKRTYT